ncbi:MAG: hypothetical protein ACI4N3_01120 [Alphaproteobacteria bacterium]
MISDLKIKFRQNGIITTLELDDTIEGNLPYNLADMFEKVIRESDVNPQMILDDLKNAFEYD